MKGYWAVYTQIDSVEHIFRTDLELLAFLKENSGAAVFWIEEE